MVITYAAANSRTALTIKCLIFSVGLTPRAEPLTAGTPRRSRLASVALQTIRPRAGGNLKVTSTPGQALISTGMDSWTLNTIVVQSFGAHDADEAARSSSEARR